MNTRASLIIAAALGIPLALLPATLAQGEEVPFTFDEPTSVQVEYGASWSFTGTTWPDFVFYGPATVVKSQTSRFPDPAYFLYYDQNAANTLQAGKMTISPSPTAAPLAVGSYPIDITLDTVGYGATPYQSRATGAILDIVPAALVVSAAVAGDATASGGAVVSATLKGAFVATAGQVAYGPSSSILPARSWNFLIKDDVGNTVLEKTVESPAGGPAAASFYWGEAEPGKEYEVSVDVSVEAAAAGNFAITAAGPAAFVSEVPARGAPVAVALGSEPASRPVGFTVPAVAAVAAGVVFLALVVAGAILILRSRRTARGATSSSSSASAAGESE